MKNIETIEGEIGQTSHATSKDHINNFMREFFCLNSSNCGNFEKYLHQFLKIVDEDDGNVEILAWWRIQSITFPILSKMVRDILDIQASSVALEAVFSATRFQLGHHRHSLAEKS